jgi:hypothetical protein
VSRNQRRDESVNVGNDEDDCYDLRIGARRSTSAGPLGSRACILHLPCGLMPFQCPFSRTVGCMCRSSRHYHVIEGVIFGPLSRIGEDLVGLVDELEHLLSLWRRVLVGMIFLGEPPVGLLDLLRSGVSGDAEDGIVVLEARQTIRSFQRSLLKRSG